MNKKVKCNVCGGRGDWEDYEVHFCGKHEIPICPVCGNEKIEDAEIIPHLYGLYRRIENGKKLKKKLKFLDH